MSRFTLCSVAALVISTNGSLYGQDGRTIDQKPLTLDESLRNEIVFLLSVPIAATTITLGGARA